MPGKPHFGGVFCFVELLYFYIMKAWVLYLFLLCINTSLFAQVSGSDALSLPVVGIHYGGAFSGADLAERYGYFNRVGLTAG